MGSRGAVPTAARNDAYGQACAKMHVCHTPFLTLRHLAATPCAVALVLTIPLWAPLVTAPLTLSAFFAYAPLTVGVLTTESFTVCCLYIFLLFMILYQGLPFWCAREGMGACGWGAGLPQNGRMTDAYVYAINITSAPLSWFRVTEFLTHPTTLGTVTGGMDMLSQIDERTSMLSQLLRCKVAINGILLRNRVARLDCKTRTGERGGGGPHKG